MQNYIQKHIDPQKLDFPVVFDYGQLTPSVYFWVWDLLLVGLLLNILRKYDEKKEINLYYSMGFCCTIMSIIISFYMSIG